MISTKTADCACGQEAALERVRYFPRQVMTAAEMTAEQQYFRQKARRHNRFLHGWGVVWGAEIKPAPTQKKPRQVRICPGYLLTPQGDEVLIGSEVLFDLATCLVESDDPCAYSRPCPPVQFAAKDKQPILYLAVRYIECHAGPVRVAPIGCGCDDAACEFSRVRDAYELCCFDKAPKLAQPDCAGICNPAILACPDASGDGWVTLASIRLRELRREIQPVNSDDINNLQFRKLVYPTGHIQDIAICNCDSKP